MKINPEPRILELLLAALDETILPALTSEAATSTAQIMRSALLDLLKRQTVSAAILIKTLSEGQALERAMAESLHIPISAADSSAPDPAAGFESLALALETLTARLADLAQQLSQQDAGSLSPTSREQLLRRAAEWEMSFYSAQMQAVPAVAPAKAPEQPPLDAGFLEKFLNRERGADTALKVESLQALSGGFGKQTYLCNARAADGQLVELVVRKSDPQPIMNHGLCILEKEFDLLRSLAKTGFPAPRPIALASHLPGVDGSFYTMPKIAGRVPGSFLGGAQTLPRALLMSLAELLARLHQYPLEAFDDYIRRHEHTSLRSMDTTACYRDNLAGWRDYVRHSEHLPSPYLVWLLDWLDVHVPEDPRAPVLVHGDFNIHNILAENEHISGVLDWECAGFGAPEQDLAYIQPHIARHIAWQDFVDHYRRCGGPELRSDIMPFCMAYAALRTNLAGNRGTHNLQSGRNRDIRYLMVELGFTRAFMELGLAATAGNP